MQVTKHISAAMQQRINAVRIASISSSAVTLTDGTRTLEVINPQQDVSGYDQLALFRTFINWLWEEYAGEGWDCETLILLKGTQVKCEEWNEINDELEGYKQLEMF